MISFTWGCLTYVYVWGPFYIVTAMAGGLAGGISNFVLYPIDLAKTLRQSDPGSQPTSLAAILLKQAR